MHDIVSPAYLKYLASVHGENTLEIQALQASIDLQEHFQLRAPVLVHKEDFVPCIIRNGFAAANSEEMLIYGDRGSFTFQAHNCEVELIGSIVAKQLFGEGYNPTLGWATGLAPYSGLVFCQEVKAPVRKLSQVLGMSDMNWNLLSADDKSAMCRALNVDFRSIAQLDVLDYIMGVPDRQLTDVLIYFNGRQWRTLLTGFSTGLFQTETTHPLTAYTDMSFIEPAQPLTSEEVMKPLATVMSQSIEVPAALVPEVACALLIQHRAEKLRLEMFIFDKEDGVYQ